MLIQKVSLSFFLIHFFFTPFLYALDHSQWDSELKLHVKDGLVEYAAWKKDLTVLDHYLESIKSYSIHDFSKDSREERMALWINVYNAAVIKKILQFYPSVKSIQQIPNFWNEKFVTVASMDYSLQEIKDQVFRKGFRDERAVLALVSGYISAGPLRADAYAGPQLAEQLKDQVNLFLSDLRYNQITRGAKKLRLSPLFRELKDDFILGYASAEPDDQFSPQEVAILSFIRAHSQNADIVEWLNLRKYKIRYLKNNWELNEYREKGV